MTSKPLLPTEESSPVPSMSAHWSPCLNLATALHTDTPSEWATPSLQSRLWLPIALRRKTTLPDMLTRPVVSWPSGYSTSLLARLPHLTPSSQTQFCSSRHACFLQPLCLGLLSSLPLSLTHILPRTPGYVAPLLWALGASGLRWSLHCPCLFPPALPTEGIARVHFLPVSSPLCPGPRRPGDAQSG